MLHTLMERVLGALFAGYAGYVYLSKELEKAAAAAESLRAADEPKCKIRALPVVTATPENFAQYGTILGDPSPTSTQSSAANHYAAVRVCNPSTNFKSDEDTHVLVLVYEPRPFHCRFLERHYKHTQTFIPLEGKPLIGFFAPPNDKDEEPDLDKVVCFKFEGNAGFVMHFGTWHEQPFPIEPSTKAVCILRNETIRELKPTNAETRECHGNDIDKLNLEARHNLIFAPEGY